MKAWLITWENIGEHASVAEPVVDILSSRVSDETVRRYLERLYIQTRMSNREKLEMARYNKPQRPIYPAEFARFGQRSIRWGGQIRCGDNPWLFARKVTNLRVTDDETYALAWDEIPVPQFLREM